MTSRLYAATWPRDGCATRKRREANRRRLRATRRFRPKIQLFLFSGWELGFEPAHFRLQNVMLRGFSATDSVDELPSADFFYARGGFEHLAVGYS
jgi:hypothetical protein